MIGAPTASVVGQQRRDDAVMAQLFGQPLPAPPPPPPLLRDDAAIAQIMQTPGAAPPLPAPPTGGMLGGGLTGQARDSGVLISIMGSSTAPAPSVPAPGVMG